MYKTKQQENIFFAKIMFSLLQQELQTLQRVSLHTGEWQAIHQQLEHHGEKVIFTMRFIKKPTSANERMAHESPLITTSQPVTSFTSILKSLLQQRKCFLHHKEEKTFPY